MNQASRFEGANKIFGSWIMIGATTFEAAKEHILARRLAYLIVKGKTEPVLVYELLDLQEDVTEERRALLATLIPAFDAALEQFRAGRLIEARQGFTAIRAKFPEDGPTLFYLDEIDRLQNVGLPGDFAGEIALDSK